MTSQTLLTVTPCSWLMNPKADMRQDTECKVIYLAWTRLLQEKVASCSGMTLSPRGGKRPRSSSWWRWWTAWQVDTQVSSGQGCLLQSWVAGSGAVLDFEWKKIENTSRTLEGDLDWAIYRWRNHLAAGSMESSLISKRWLPTCCRCLWVSSSSERSTPPSPSVHLYKHNRRQTEHET